MNEQQVRDRISATADTIDCSPVPLAAIKSTGRTIVRRRTRARVVGYAAAIVGAVGLAVAVPIIGLAEQQTDARNGGSQHRPGRLPARRQPVRRGDCDAIPGVREEHTNRRAASSQLPDPHSGEPSRTAE